MWVGFLYTVVRSELIDLGVTSVSRKGIDPSVLNTFVVHCMGGSM